MRQWWPLGVTHHRFRKGWVKGSFLLATSSGQGTLLSGRSGRKPVVRKIISFKSFQRILPPLGQCSNSFYFTLFNGCHAYFYFRSRNSKAQQFQNHHHAGSGRPCCRYAGTPFFSVCVTGTTHMNRTWAGLQGKGCFRKSSNTSTSPRVLSVRGLQAQNGFYGFSKVEKKIFHGT